jgi:hypothetical protein
MDQRTGGKTSCNKKLGPHRIKQQASQEHATNSTNTITMDRLHVLGLSLTLIGSTPPSLHPISWFNQRIATKSKERWSVSRRCYLYEFVASNQLKREESRSYETITMNSGSTKNSRIKGRIWHLRGQDHIQRCTSHPPMTPLKKSEQEHPQWMNQANHKKPQK